MIEFLIFAPLILLIWLCALAVCIGLIIVIIDFLKGKFS